MQREKATSEDAAKENRKLEVWGLGMSVQGLGVKI